MRKIGKIDETVESCENRCVVNMLQSPELTPGSVLRSVTACLLGTFLLRMAASVMGNMLQLYFGYIDTNLYPLSFTLRSIATAIFFLPELVGSPILGSWSDSYGRKLFIMIGPVSGAIAVQLTAMTSHFGLLAVTRLLEGLSTASAIPATLGYLSAVTSRHESLRGKVMGFFEIATIGGTMAGVLVAGRLWDALGRSAFTLDSAIYLLSLVVFFVGIVEAHSAMSAGTGATRRRVGSGMQVAREALRHSFVSIRAALSSAKVLRFVPAWLAINMILGAWFNSLIGQLVETSNRFPNQLLYGLFAESARAGTEISVYAAAVMGIFAFGIVLWSFTLGRFRRTGVMLLSALGLFLLCGFLFALNHAGSLNNPLLPVEVGGAILGLVVVSGFTPAAVTYLADVTEDDPTDRGAIMGLYSVFFGVGQLFGTLLAGPFVDARGMDGLIFLTVLLGIAATGALVQLHRYEAHLRALPASSGTRSE